MKLKKRTITKTNLQGDHRRRSLAFECQCQTGFTQAAIDGDRGKDNQAENSDEMKG